MNNRDRPLFVEVLTTLAGLHRQSLSDTAVSLYWNALADYDWSLVRAALDAHVRSAEGRFFPLPAHIIAKISDGRPTADEFWPAMPLSEDATVVWTAEAKTAFFTALPLIERGDLIAARMSFRDAYEAACNEARAAKMPISWEVSLGHDFLGRAPVVQRAVMQGRLTSKAAQKLLPHVDFSDCVHLVKRHEKLT